MKIWLAPYISVRRAADRLRLGTLPPVAYEVEDPPPFLADLLTELGRNARDRDDVVADVTRSQGWSAPEVNELIDDLEAIGVLTAEFDRTDRYDRHRLYYRMLGIDGDPQQRLQNATVGLVGMGGIGSNLAVHLAAAGIGRLVITDGDRIEASNLTRQTLYRESDIGRLKVEAAAEHLAELRADLKVEVIPEDFTDPGLAQTVAERADIILLSADRPASVHSWANSAAILAGIAFSAAGYIEGHGCVGPLLRPPATMCYECIRTAADALPGQVRDAADVRESATELNPSFQAPSYGPLNGLVASIQANEAIRWLLGAPVATQERRLLIDSRTYAVTWEEFDPTETCAVCGRVAEQGNADWDAIAELYREERAHHSFNSVLLDGLIPSLLPPLGGTVVADVGAGAGEMSAELLKQGATVDAYEPSAAMRGLLEERLADGPPSKLRIHHSGLEALTEQAGTYDAALCLNVLDHIPDLPWAIGTLAAALRPGGTLVLSIPHPIKDRGNWNKVPTATGWSYEHYMLNNYFDEGLCRKAREDRHGNVRVRNVATYHRTTATYLESMLAAGLTITRVLEPSPDPQTADNDPVLYSKASRLPYFLVLVATRGGTDA
ncbi:MAG: TOMM precursor leader peptide-binding protein [Mycobacterium sp.]|uniref:TOMM precursor leader peptide-binding protein n=1 Tax=Mycobacterium sp. TaxID=1785 RepID=UPI003BE35430